MAAVQSLCSPGHAPRSRVHRDAASPAPLGDNSWHFPFGPSSQFHRSERTRPSHTRVKSNYTPISPALSTERRIAHRRTRSSANAGACAAHQVNESGRSPLSQFCSNARRPATATIMASRPSPENVPRTPVKTAHRPHERLHDSPFSDYFTDEARSVDRSQSWGAIAPETQRLLVRLNTFQAQLMREDYPQETLRMVESKMDEIEQGLGDQNADLAFHRDMRDSGLFMEDDVDLRQENQKPDLQSRSLADKAVLEHLGHDTSGFGSEGDLPFTTEHRAAKNDFLLLKSHRILDNLNRSHGEYQKRLNELKAIVEDHAATIEERDHQIEDLNQENESLKSDLGSDNSELLFLKLQLKALEVEVHEKVDQATELALPRKINDEFNNGTRLWRDDWAEVDSRFKQRRSAYGIVTDAERKGTQSAMLDCTPDPWEVDTVKKTNGRVSTIIVRRVDPSSSHEDTEQGPDAIFRNQCTDSSTQTAAPALTESRPKDPAYAHNSVQTDPVPHAPFATGLCESDDPFLGDENHDGDDDGGDGCGSGGGNENNNDDDDDQNLVISPKSARETEATDCTDNQKSSQPADLSSVTLSPVKMAWQELWQSLSEMAGMGDERF